jgi:hypothetical protein
MGVSAGHGAAYTVCQHVIKRIEAMIKKVVASLSPLIIFVTRMISVLFSKEVFINLTNYYETFRLPSGR